MKRKLLFLLPPLIFLSFSPIKAQIVNIPDANFKALLIADPGINANNDGEIQYSEAGGYTGSINVNSQNISDLTGIAAFTSLSALVCYNNQLTSLNLSSNTALTFLSCHTNQLTSLNVSTNTALTTLACSNNQITSLNVSANTALATLICQNNQLTSLNLSTGAALQMLHCYDNQLTSLNLSTATALTELKCYNNQLTSLNVPANTSLTTLLCYNNQLTSLNLSSNTALTFLSCHTNQLTSLNVSTNTALTTLACSNNQLVSLNVSTNTALGTLICHSNLLTSLNVSTNTALTWLACFNNQLTSLDVSTNTALIDLSCNGNVLTSLNLQNSNNSNLTAFDATSNPGLDCIQVDDAMFMDANWVSAKDAGASYNVDCSSGITISNVIDNNSSFSTPWSLWTGFIYQPSAPIKICADGSAATQVYYTNNNPGIASGNIRFKIASDPSAVTPNISGVFSTPGVNGNIVTSTLSHPTYLQSSALFRTDTILVVNQQNSATIYKIPIEYYRAPVLMVHGIWSDYSAFQSMENTLDGSGLYPPMLTSRVDYSSSNSYHFANNAALISYKVDGLLHTSRNNGFSAGKIDYIGHSMGGILGRMHIQSPFYKSDIHKLITINTPHLGSQAADFLRNPNYSMIATLLTVAFGKNCFNGAVDDLKTNSNEIIYLYSNSISPNAGIGCHAIYTKSNTTLNLGWESLFVNHGTLAAGFATQTGFVQDLYQNDDNDLVVPVASQTCGMGGVTVFFVNNQIHTGSPANIDVILAVADRLDEDPMGVSFSQTGFPQPAQFPLISSYAKPSGTNGPSQQTTAGTVSINSPASGQQVIPGQQVTVDVTSVGDINHLIIAEGNADLELSFTDTAVANAAINYTIPQNAIGKIVIAASGFDNNSMLDWDTVSLYVNITAALDSIRFYPEEIYVPVNNQTGVNLVGYFNDGYQRNLTTVSGISYSIADPTIATLAGGNLIEGQLEGATILAVTYQGVSVNIPVIVFPEDTSIHFPTSIPGAQFSQSDNLNLIKIYPNPNNGTFMLELASNPKDLLTIEIYNQLGQRVYSQQDRTHSQSYQHTISLNEPPGIYFIRVKTGNNISSSKVVLLK